MDLAGRATPNAHDPLVSGAVVELDRGPVVTCLAGVQPKVAYESRTPHTLLAMAESGHGVAIIPSGLRTDRHRLRTVAGEPLVIIAPRVIQGKTMRR